LGFQAWLEGYAIGRQSLKIAAQSAAFGSDDSRGHRDYFRDMPQGFLSAQPWGLP
jgi:hypothetical protein